MGVERWTWMESECWLQGETPGPPNSAGRPRLKAPPFMKMPRFKPPPQGLQRQPFRVQVLNVVIVSHSRFGKGWPRPSLPHTPDSNIPGGIGSHSMCHIHQKRTQLLFASRTGSCPTLTLLTCRAGSSPLPGFISTSPTHGPPPQEQSEGTNALCCHLVVTSSMAFSKSTLLARQLSGAPARCQCFTHFVSLLVIMLEGGNSHSHFTDREIEAQSGVVILLQGRGKDKMVPHLLTPSPGIFPLLQS